MQDLMGKLDELGIHLIIADIEKSGYYIPKANSIIANSLLEENELKEVVLHELKHIMSHSEYAALYKSSFSARSKMENEANIYMIEELIKEHEGHYNYSCILEEYQLGLGSEELFKKIEKAY